MISGIHSLEKARALSTEETFLDGDSSEETGDSPVRRISNTRTFGVDKWLEPLLQEKVKKALSKSIAFHRTPWVTNSTPNRLTR